MYNVSECEISESKLGNGKHSDRRLLICKFNFYEQLKPCHFSTISLNGNFKAISMFELAKYSTKGIKPKCCEVKIMLITHAHCASPSFKFQQLWTSFSKFPQKQDIYCESSATLNRVSIG